MNEPMSPEAAEFNEAYALAATTVATEQLDPVTARHRALLSCAKAAARADSLRPEQKGSYRAAFYRLFHDSVNFT